MGQVRRLPAHRLVYAGFDGVVRRQSLHPGRQEQVQLPQGKFIQQPLQQLRDLLLPQLQTVHRQAADVIPPLDVRCHGLGPGALGLGGVQQHHKGLAKLLQLPDHPLLGLQIVLPGDLRDAAVGGDHDAHGGVVADDLPGAQLRRLGHGDLVVVPGGHHHPGRQVLILAHSAGHHIPHAVDEPHGERDPLLHADLHRLLRHELGFGGHDGAAGAALGQLIPGPVPAVAVLDIGQHLGLHKALDEGGFSGAHRPHHADVNAAAGPGRHILINGCGLIHGPFLLLHNILSGATLCVPGPG